MSRIQKHFQWKEPDVTTIKCFLGDVKDKIVDKCLQTSWSVEAKSPFQPSKPHLARVGDAGHASVVEKFRDSNFSFQRFSILAKLVVAARISELDLGNHPMSNQIVGVNL